MLKAAPAEGARKAPMPHDIRPMLATAAEEIFSDAGWTFEVKWDGVRALCFISGGRARLVSRNGRELGSQYPEVLAAASQAAAGHAEMILDGEIVAFDEGRPSFQKLQRRMNLSQDGRIERMAEAEPVVYCVFDILYLDGYLLTGCSFTERRRILQNSLTPSAQVTVPTAFEERGEELYAAARSGGLEGVVGKRKTSTYTPGRRSTNWLKFKILHTMDAVIGGYTEPRGGRRFFGALLLGLYSENVLRYVGHTGTGFDQETLAAVYERLQPLRTDACPFESRPRTNTPAHWLRPELVAEIKYAEITDAMNLRHPVFLRLRDDKPPHDCTLSDQLPARPERHDPSEIRLTNADKPLWPRHAGRPAVTKKMLADYYLWAAEAILPYTRGRPLMLNRYPEGVAGPSFYQKSYTDPLPEGVDEYVYYSHHAGRNVRHVICSNRKTLKWLAQVACVELNCWTARTDQPLLPDFMVLDIDPYITWAPGQRGAALNADDFAAAVQVAGMLKELLDQIGLVGYLKTSGQRGLHVFVPIRREYAYSQVRSYARTLAHHMVQLSPDLITTEWRETDRAGKVFFDYTINAPGKTLCGPYSPRPTAEATISTPIRWDELRSVRPGDFTIHTIRDRIKETGDLWLGILRSAQKLA